MLILPSMSSVVLSCVVGVLAHIGHHDSDLDKTIAQVQEALLVEDDAKALRLLDQLDDMTQNEGSEDHAIVVAALRLEALTATIDKTVSQNGDMGDLPERQRDQYVMVERLVTDSLQRQLDGHNEMAAIQDYASLQRLTNLYVQSLSLQGKISEAIRATAKLLELYRRIGMIANRKTRLRYISNGETHEKVSTIGSTLGLRTEEQMVQGIISLSQRAFHSSNSPRDKEQLISYLETYLDRWPREPYAGVYLKKKMTLEGNFNIDALLEIYVQIENKTHEQYIYSTLGLSNLLNQAGRHDEALKYLKHIKHHGIHPSRLAEMNYAFGEAYFEMGDHKNALPYFMAVKAMTDRYPSVDNYIGKMLGTPSSPDKILDGVLNTELFNGTTNRSSSDAAIGIAEGDDTGISPSVTSEGAEAPNDLVTNRGLLYLTSLVAVISLSAVFLIWVTSRTRKRV